MKNLQEKKKVPILFIEADGIHVKSQEVGKESMEIKLAAVHEGWDDIGKEKRLKNLRGIYGHEKSGDAFWEAFMAQLLKYYETDEDVVIVVNGDGAHGYKVK